MEMNSSYMIQKWGSRFHHVDSNIKRMKTFAFFPIMKAARTVLHGLVYASVFLLSSCNGESVTGDESSPPKPLLRYVVPMEDRDIYLDEMVKQCSSMGIREVLLFTMISWADYGGDAFFEDK